GEVRLGEGFDAVIRGREAGLHAHEPKGVADARGDRRPAAVRSIEGEAQILPVLRAILLHAFADLVELLDRYAFGALRGLHHSRRYCTDEHRLGDAIDAVPTD